mgnify:CR=1 FL=1
MKVGDLVVYNLGASMKPLGDYKDVAIVVAERVVRKSLDIRNFRIYYPYYKEYLNGWEDEYRVIS